MTKFIVETLTTFREVHVIEAETREMAEKIATHSDYNMSKHISTEPMATYEYNDVHIDRFKTEDDFFWDGVKSVNENGYLVYTTAHGPKVTDEKIF